MPFIPNHSAPTPRTCYKVWPGTQNLRSLRQDTETKSSRPEAKVTEHRGRGRGAERGHGDLRQRTQHMEGTGWGQRARVI